MNMLVGDVLWVVFKGLLRASGVQFEDNNNVTLKLGDDKEIQGEYDLILDDKVDDIKSASPWSYNNKFVNLETLQQGDSFGYVSQLVGYAKGADKDVGGWWVVNKANGKFKYVSAENADEYYEMSKIRATVETLKYNKFERCFEDSAETWRGKPTGNRRLGITCGFCDYKHTCWENLKELPSVMSKAKIPPTVYYTELQEKYL